MHDPPLLISTTSNPITAISSTGSTGSTAAVATLGSSSVDNVIQEHHHRKLLANDETSLRADVVEDEDEEDDENLIMDVSSTIQNNATEDDKKSEQQQQHLAERQIEQYQSTQQQNDDDVDMDDDDHHQQTSYESGDNHYINSAKYNHNDNNDDSHDVVMEDVSESAAIDNNTTDDNITQKHLEEEDQDDVEAKKGNAITIGIINKNNSSMMNGSSNARIRSTISGGKSFVGSSKTERVIEIENNITSVSHNSISNHTSDADSSIPATGGSTSHIEEKSTTANNGAKKSDLSASALSTSVAEVNGATTSASVEGRTTAASASNSATTAHASAPPPPPVLKGTLAYDLDQRRHLIRGMWNYENSTDFPPQRFELIRNLMPGEDEKLLPQDGEFHGSFSLAYFHITSKGKQKERSKVIPESGVHIKFTPVPAPDENGNHEKLPNEYKVDGKGTNQFGVFQIYGTAIRSTLDGDPSLHVVLRKRYDPTDQPVALISTAMPAVSAIGAQAESAEQSGRPLHLSPSIGPSTTAAVDHEDGPLPEPSRSFASAVVCLRGKLYKEESGDLGLSEVVHRIQGMWASGLDFILADPQNVRGLCNRFEYEHKSSVPSHHFPVSGRYSGWFDLSNEDGSRTRINERDVTLKFRKNNAGYHNVEGKGSNVFGKYSITGTFTLDHVITIFRHFQPRKLKAARSSSTTASSSSVIASLTPPSSIATISPPGTNTSVNTVTDVTTSSTAVPNVRRPSSAATMEVRLKLDDVPTPSDGKDPSELLDPIDPPPNGNYSAISRGILRLNDDGAHSCTGKWSVTRDHFTNGQTSNFNFRLESHFAADAVSAKRDGTGDATLFPLDSEMYKGSFQLKKHGSRYQTIVDQQVVMKFRKNSQGSYNVYGKGYNAIGEFNLLGTLVMSGKSGGQVELYRMYPPEKLAVQHPAPKLASASSSVVAAPTSASSETAKIETTASGAVGAPPPILTTPAPTMSAVAPLASEIPSTSTFSGPPKFLGPPAIGIQRRESTRLVKLPSRLEDDDPTAQLSRTMEKCSQILRIIREKDVELGGFFAEPVDPVALGIPTYHQVIREPMDLRTVYRRMEAGEINDPDDFARLVKLVFENAIKFNIDPTHTVHQAARNLLVLFNQKFRDVERTLQNMRRSSDGDDKGKKKIKDDKKRKRQGDEPKSLKRRRFEEAEAMAIANATALSSIIAAAPLESTTYVTRAEYSMLLSMVQQLQKQMVATFTGLAELTPEEEVTETAPMTASTMASSSTVLSAQAPTSSTIQPTNTTVPKKPPAKRKSEGTAPSAIAASAAAAAAAVAADESRPLSLEEQELLTETINELPPEHLGVVIQIIREAAPVGADEDEIVLEIDQLDTVTQRKLLRHVSKFVKKSKAKIKKKPAAAKPSSKGERSNSATKKSSTSSKSTAKPKPATDSFFAFGGKNDSDSDSDRQDDNDEEEGEVVTTANKVNTNAGGGKYLSGVDNDFELNTGVEGVDNDIYDDDDDDDDDNDLGGTAAPTWTLTKQQQSTSNGNGSDKKYIDDDKEWGAFRKQAEVNKAREADRKAREEKMKEEAEQAKHQRLADAAKRSEEIKAQRKEEEEQEAKFREEKEKKEEEQRRLAREAARKEVQSVEQTVDLDAQRDIMKQYEQSFLDKDLGGASPSSDFGF